MFTPEEREHVRDHVLDLARNDPRVMAGALTGSSAVGAEDQWSDIDLSFGITDGVILEDVLKDWTEEVECEFGALDHFDLRAGSSIFRVFLLPSGLEIDIAVTPQQEFGSRGPRFRSLFGPTHETPATPQPDPRHLIGLGWHHILHSRSCIERGKRWQAEYWMSAARDHALALACLRLGEDAVYGRGVDRLPTTVTAPLADALVHSVEESELRRALGAVTACFIAELDAWDLELSARLKGLLLEFGRS